MKKLFKNTLKNKEMNNYADSWQPLKKVAFSRHKNYKFTAQAKVLCDLIRFYEDSPENAEIVQDSHIGNWAYAYRYGEITCILIDLGL